jgi:hypothetical protein
VFSTKRKEKRRLYLLRGQWALIGKVYCSALSFVFEIEICGGGDAYLVGKGVNHVIKGRH